MSDADSILSEGQARAEANAERRRRLRAEEWRRVQAAVPKDDMDAIMAWVKTFDAKIESITCGEFEWSPPKELR